MGKKSALVSSQASVRILSIIIVGCVDIPLDGQLGGAGFLLELDSWRVGLWWGGGFWKFLGVGLVGKWVRRWRGEGVLRTPPMPAGKPALVRPRWRVVSTVEVRAGVLP